MLWFSMHNPNSFPQQLNVNNFLRLKAGKWYEMTYNRWKTILLEPPYKTECRHYNLDDIKYFKLRSDCVTHCIQKEVHKKCSPEMRIKIIDPKNNNSTECLYRSDVLWRRDAFNKTYENLSKFCPKFSKPETESSTEEDIKRRGDNKRCIDNNISHLNSECEKRCRLECLNRFYNYNVKTNIKHHDWEKTWDRLASITIAHNQLPDQITEHIPEMTFVQFSGSFGGLFGIWLGLSALAILQYILKIL